MSPLTNSMALYLRTSKFPMSSASTARARERTAVSSGEGIAGGVSSPSNLLMQLRLIDSLVCTEGGNYGVQGLREQQWAAGDVQIGKQSEKRDNDGKPSSGECLNSDRNLDFKLNMAGVLDAGASAYAAAGKLVPSTSQASQGSGAPDRYIVYLWLTGNFFASIDFPGASRLAFGAR